MGYEGRWDMNRQQASIICYLAHLQQDGRCSSTSSERWGILLPVYIGMKPTYYEKRKILELPFPLFRGQRWGGPSFVVSLTHGTDSAIAQRVLCGPGNRQSHHPASPKAEKPKEAFIYYIINMFFFCHSGTLLISLAFAF